MSTKDEKKAETEREVFWQFVQALGWPSSREAIVSGMKGQPDIIYSGFEHKISFELTEICSGEVAKAIGDIDEGGFWMVGTSDPTKNRLDAKRNKVYESEYPVDLVCYWNMRTASPDWFVRQQIAQSLKNHEMPTFKHVWCAGEQNIFKFSPQGQIIKTVPRSILVYPR